MGRAMGGTNKIWTTEEKIRIVNRYLNNEGSQKSIALKESIASGLMTTLISKYYKGSYEARKQGKSRKSIRRICQGKVPYI